MCTATWARRVGGFDLMFNRDESRRRSPALAPRLHRTRDVRFLAPLDGDFGGTWISVNEYGLALGLLNGYRDSDDPPGRRSPSHRADDYVSRGRLVMELAGAQDVAETIARIQAMDLTSFRSLRLLVLDPAQARIARWDDRGLDIAATHRADLPLVSSAYDQARVTRVRRASFADHSADRDDDDTAASYLAYHRSHQPERGPLSPCMHREDAHTVSFTHVLQER